MSGCLGPGAGAREIYMTEGHKEVLGVMIVVMFSWMYTYVKIIQLNAVNMFSILHVNYTSRKLKKDK